MFRCDHHHQGAYCVSLLKVTMLKHLVKTHHCGYSGDEVAYVIRSLLVYVCCTVRNLTESGSEHCSRHTPARASPVHFDTIYYMLFYFQNPYYCGT